MMASSPVLLEKCSLVEVISTKYQEGKTMVKSLFNNMEDMYCSPYKAYEDDGIETTITFSPAQCSLRLKKEIGNSKKAKEFIELINAGQSLARYNIVGDTLILDTTMLVEKKPTFNGIKLLSDQYLSQFRSVLLLLGGIADEQ